MSRGRSGSAALTAWLACSLLAAAGLASLVAPARAAGDDVKQLRQQMLAAYQAKDYPLMLSVSLKILALDPGNPKQIFNVALAETKTGDTASASKHLIDLADRGLDFGIADADEFVALRASKDYEPLKRRLDELRTPLGKAQPGFTLVERDQIPEGIAYDATGRTWYVSSVHHRKIVARTDEGKIADFVKEGEDGLFSVLGMAIDAKRRWLWACTSALPEMTGYDKALEGHTGVYKYDLASGKLLKKYMMAGEAHPRALGDVVVAPSGDVYLSDGLTGGVYRILLAKDEIEEFVAPGVLRSAQGMAFPTGEKTLYVANYGGGVIAVDVATGARRDVASPEKLPLLGIDGLVAYGNGFIVTQNGIDPHRVTRYYLDAAGDRVERGEILEINDPRFRDPTLGVVVGDFYYFVANSQWGLFDKESKLPGDARLAAPLVLRIPLGG
ncbi:MAG: SMP-30/gluconolactonase/LRE family protein [Acidobacteria bacterium]|nr:SMP-30/gluconolactonase/LRE family protein [Acidobacteriota bacterium]